jgi:hypothetical protein
MGQTHLKVPAGGAVAVGQSRRPEDLRTIEPTVSPQQQTPERGAPPIGTGRTARLGAARSRAMGAREFDDRQHRTHGLLGYWARPPA